MDDGLPDPGNESSFWELSQLHARHSSPIRAGPSGINSINDAQAAVEETVPQTDHGQRKTFDCDICAFKSTRKYNLQRHTREFHTNKCLLCNYCGATFKSKYGLNLHTLAHQDKFKYRCPVCDNGFNEKQKYQRHIDMHANVKRFKCHRPECKCEFRYLKDLRRHQNSTHDNVNHVCALCAKPFATVDALRYHNRAAHENIAKYKCDICHKFYRYRSSLKYHKDKHHKTEDGLNASTETQE